MTNKNFQRKVREVLDGERHSVYCPSCTWDMSIGMLCCGNEDTCPIKRAIKSEQDKQKREDILYDSDERFDDGYWL